MTHPSRRIPAFADDRAQTLAEYSVLVGVIAIVVLAALPQVAAPILGFFNSAAQAFGA